MFNMLFINLIINKNIIKISLNEVIKIFKKNVVHIILITNIFINEIKKQNIIFVNFYESGKND